jgi:hydroxymethylpyrimidine/phosphomethylpyrimidine kinase
MRTTLTIAGSDSSAGAGVQADLKTFAALGLYGFSAITAVTAQNTSGISEVFALPPQVVCAQIDAVARDVEIAAIKTGMLTNGEIVSVVADAIGRLGRAAIVVDPVMTATQSGARTLLSPDAVSTLKTRLLPMATVVTPNVAEAETLCGVRVSSLESAREAAKRIADLGPSAVVVKGGHLSGPEAVDLLLYQGRFIELAAPRAPVGDVHGTGCTFASGIAAGLALGDDVPAAVQRAKKYVTGAIEHSFQIGRGARLLNHFWEFSL